MRIGRDRASAIVAVIRAEATAKVASGQLRAASLTFEANPARVLIWTPQMESCGRRQGSIPFGEALCDDRGVMKLFPYEES